MDYKKIYDQLVEKAKPRGLDKTKHEGYFEIHHIVPRCMGGGDEESNLVMFTAREHVISHKLLWKVYPENYSLMWAYFRTVNTHKGILTSREVERVKIERAEYMRNREVSDETREKISKTLMGHKRTPESVEKTAAANRGMKRSKETKKLLSQRRQELLASGWTMPEEARKKIGDANRGAVRSQEFKDNLSAIYKGKIMPAHVIAATSAYQKSLRPWQKSASVARPARAKVWADAQFSYLAWLKNNKPKSYSFSKVMSELHGVEYKRYHFDKLVSMFQEGWVPEQDLQWLEFKREYEEKNE